MKRFASLAAVLLGACSTEGAGEVNPSVLNQFYRCTNLYLHDVQDHIGTIAQNFDLTYHDRADSTSGDVFIVTMRQRELPYPRYDISYVSNYLAVSVFVERGQQPSARDLEIFNRMKALFPACQPLKRGQVAPPNHLPSKTQILRFQGSRGGCRRTSLNTNSTTDYEQLTLDATFMLLFHDPTIAWRNAAVAWDDVDPSRNVPALFENAEMQAREEAERERLILRRSDMPVQEAVIDR